MCLVKEIVFLNEKTGNKTYEENVSNRHFIKETTVIINTKRCQYHSLVTQEVEYKTKSF